MENNYIYFDNAASSGFKPSNVKKAVNKAMEENFANAGRGGHKLAIDSSLKLMQARETLSEYFHLSDSNRLVFTYNCTLALNMAIIGTVKYGDNVITTNMEHNSVLRPLFELERKGIISVTIINMNEDGIVTADMIDKNIRYNTSTVITTHISNVIGTKNPIEDIGKLCKNKNIKYIVDAAQSVGHIDIDFDNSNIDILCFAGHKGLYGLQSLGGLLVSKEIKITPIILGGTGVDSNNAIQESKFPENFESGTVSLPLIMALEEGVKYVNNNKNFIQQRLIKNSQYLLEKLSNLKDIKLYSNPKNNYGVVAINIKDVDCSILSEFLSNEYNICTRSGLHCAPLIHQQLTSETTNGGAVRISLSHKNTRQEIEVLIEALEDFILKNHL